MTSYKALTFIELGGKKFAPGDKINKSDISGAGEQSDESIAALLKDKVISEDMDAPVNEAHIAPEPDPNVITAGDEGSGTSGSN